MSISEPILVGLAEHVRAFALGKLAEKGLSSSLTVDSIMLYGGAARFHMGLAAHYHDYDLNVFYRKARDYHIGDARRFNRRGAFWNAGIYASREVQVLFNILDPEVAWSEGIASRQSKRWKVIQANPIMLLWPIRNDRISLAEGPI